MSESFVDNTFTAYLGHDFQLKLMWQLLVEPEFAEKTIPNLAIEYFDDPNLKRLFVIVLEYQKEFEKVPNLQNKSIYQAVFKYKTPNNYIEEETLSATIERIKLWNERVINKQILHDGDAIQKSTIWFIKQQEYRKIAEYIIEKVKTGEMKNKFTVNFIEDKFLKTSEIGNDDDTSEEVFENLERALRENFRETIPTGVDVLDTLTGGGLGRSELGLILAPLGTGKSTLLTIIANTGHKIGKNVAQIIFEDKIDDIKRKHCAIWSGIPLSQIDKNKDLVLEKSFEKSINNDGKLIIKKFTDENTTIVDVRNWMLSYEKKHGFKFDLLVLDYLDCLESHIKSNDRNESELHVVKGLISLTNDLDIPTWSALQGGRQSIEAEIVEMFQMGGSIKRGQKANFVMTLAKTSDQKLANLATIKIVKARFVKDGYLFKDCIFNNDTMEVIIEDDRFKNTINYVNLKKETESIGYDNFSEKTVQEKSSQLELHNWISLNVEDILDKINEDELSGKYLDGDDKINDPNQNTIVNDENIVIDKIETNNNSILYSVPDDDVKINDTNVFNTNDDSTDIDFATTNIVSYSDNISKYLEEKRKNQIIINNK
jgi:replicative DNA helicase